MMTPSDPYLPPSPPLPGSLVVGPLSWRRKLSKAAVDIQGCDGLAEAATLATTADSATTVAGSFPAAATAGRPGLVLLHGDLLHHSAGLTGLARDIGKLMMDHPGFLPVLLYRHLDADDCSTLFRAGLFDAVRVPVDAQRWNDLLKRAGTRIERERENHIVREQSEATASRLHAHRRQLQDEVAGMQEELIRAQQCLEKTNQELADHMAQLSLLYRFGRDLSTASNWDRTLEQILECLASFVGADGAALVLRAAASGPYTPRQTYQWEESSWDRVLLKLEDQLGQQVAAGILAPGVFHFAADMRARRDGASGIVALPLEHQGQRLGYLLLLDRSVEGKSKHPRQFLSFLQAVQLFLAEEVASAQMLDRLREIGSFNARVLESVRSFIWVVDELGRTIYCNRAAREVLTGRAQPVAPDSHGGLDIGRQRLIGKDVAEHTARLSFDLRQDDSQPELFLDGLLRLDGVDGTLLRQLMSQADKAFTGNGQVLRPGGVAIPVSVQTSIMVGRGPGEKWLVVVMEDLREAKKLEAERIRADNLQGLVEMSATLAHEIRNPLMGLSAQAELLSDQLPAGDDRIRYLEVITSEVGRINDTIDRLLHFVRPYEPDLSAVDLLELAADSLALVRHRATDKQIGLTLCTEPDNEDKTVWRQLLDASQIKQVLLNLLLNGVDAAPNGGEVQLRLELKSRIELSDVQRGTTQSVPGIVLAVSDSGPGVPVQDIENIFRPFFTTKSAGTGLGLSICHKIVAAHGGDIRVAREGEHTYFRVLLPQRKVTRQARREQETSS